MRTVSKTVKVKKVEVLVYNRDTKVEEVLETEIIMTDSKAKAVIPENCTPLEPVKVVEEKDVTYVLSPQRFFEVATVKED